MDGGEAHSLRCDGDRCDRAPQPEFSRAHPACRDPHAAGHRERGRAHRGQHLPGRADLRSAALQPSHSRLCPVPRPARRALSVRLEYPPRRRRDGRARGKRRPRDPARPREGQLSATHGTAGARYDCIVVGGGHNGLTCAAYLARAARSVLVLEAAPRLGGAAVTREFAPGFRVSACAHLLHQMPGALMRELKLKAHGLTLAAERMPTIALSADDRHLLLPSDKSAALAAHSAADAAAYPVYGARLARLAAGLQPVLGATPPRLGTSDWRDRATLLGLGWRLRALGRRDLRELLRIGAMCVQDLLDEHFESPLLKGALALDAVLGTNYGPRSPGTVFTLLYRLSAAGGDEILSQPAGGLGALSEALAAAALTAGAHIRTGAAVA